MAGAHQTIFRQLVTIAVAIVATGGMLVGGAMAASASSPKLSFAPNSDIGSAQFPVTATASGFSKKVGGGLAVCSTVSPQPTITVPSVTGTTPIPVSCSIPHPQKTNGKGGFSTAIVISSGVLGPPAMGSDSTGGDAATDAQNFPCPPTAAQVATGASCELEYIDTAGESAGDAISYGFESTTTTTSATATTQPCNATSNSASAVNSSTGTTATLNVDPATCLVGGMRTTVTGSGFVPNSIGSVLECNGDTGQPVVNHSGALIPVSCSPLALMTTTSSGGLPNANQSFTVLETSPGFTIGGQNSGTEQNSKTDTSCTGACTGNLAADAANYPCPPTSAQVAAGDSCVIAAADLGLDEVAVPISFNTAVAAPPGGGATAGTSSAKTSATKSATASATKTSASSLAFTGPGPMLRLLGIVGVALITLGLLLLVAVDAPRRLLMTGARRRRPPEGSYGRK
jgi:hypothetical protein